MEKKNYFRFGLIVLQDLLGYDVRKDLDYEEENIEFSFWDIYRQKGVCIEENTNSSCIVKRVYVLR